MADIFLANDQVLERLVVIKMLLPQYAGDPAFVERFRREATSAAKLNHKNVVAVYDWGSHDDTFYMAMEYVDGQSLAELLVASPKLPLDTALAITSEAAAGLGFAHANGMVHRDVKPGNIMLTTTGEVKVADFGIAQALDGGESLTQTGNVMGTAAYFSPEQARGEEVDRRSDLYSLGVVLFEMVTGQRPFSGSSPVSIAYKHVGEAPPAPTAIDGSLPPAVDALLDNLLAKDPGHRYGDAAELRTELQRVAEGHQPAPPAAVRHAAAAAGYAARPPAAPVSGEATAVIQPGLQPHPSDGATAMVAPDIAAGQRYPAPPPVARSSGNGFFIMALAALVVAAIVLIVIIASSLSGGGDGSSSDSSDTTDSAPAPGIPVTDGNATTTSSEPEESTTTEADESTTTEEETTTTEADESTTTEEETTTSRRTTTTTRPSTTTTTTRPSTTTTTTTTTTTSTTSTTTTTTTEEAANNTP